MKRIVKEVSLLQLHRNENKMKRVFGFGILLFSLLDPANITALALGEDEDKIVWQIQYRILDKDEDESK